MFICNLNNNVDVDDDEQYDVVVDDDVDEYDDDECDEDDDSEKTISEMYVAPITF